MTDWSGHVWVIVRTVAALMVGDRGSEREIEREREAAWTRLISLSLSQALSQTLSLSHPLVDERLTEDDSEKRESRDKESQTSLRNLLSCRQKAIRG